MLFRCKWHQRLLSTAAVLCLQEVHADPFSAEAVAERTRATHSCFASVGQPTAAGGLLTYVRDDVACDACATDIVPGRVLAVLIPAKCSQAACCFVNIHNHDLNHREIHRLRRYLRRIQREHDGVDTFLLGDFNFSPADCHTAHIGVGSHQHVPGQPGARPLETSAPGYDGAAHGQPTHAAFRQTTSGRTLSHSCIDRVFCSVPLTTIALTKVSFAIDDIANAIQTQDHTLASDHVPIAVMATIRPPLPAALRPIPSWVTRHPMYAKRVQARLRRLPLTTLHAADAVRRTRQILRAEAAVVRHACLSRRPRTEGEVVQQALQVARAVHHRDDGAIQREKERWPALARLFDDTCDPTRPRSSTALHRLLGKAISDLAALTPQQTPTEPRGRPSRNAKRQPRLTKTAQHNVMLRPAVKRWHKLWVPHLRRQWIVQILPEPGVTCTGKDDADHVSQDDGSTTIRRALQRYCAPIFRASTIDETAADQLVGAHIRPLGGDRAALHKARDTATGPDGLPYSAWRAGGHGCRSGPPSQQQGFIRGRGTLQNVLKMGTCARCLTMRAIGFEWDGDDGGIGGNDDHDDATLSRRRRGRTIAMSEEDAPQARRRRTTTPHIEATPTTATTQLNDDDPRRRPTMTPTTTTYDHDNDADLRRTPHSHPQMTPTPTIHLQRPHSTHHDVLHSLATSFNFHRHQAARRTRPTGVTSQVGASAVCDPSPPPYARIHRAAPTTLTHPGAAAPARRDALDASAHASTPRDADRRSATMTRKRSKDQAGAEAMRAPDATAPRRSATIARVHQRGDRGCEATMRRRPLGLPSHDALPPGRTPPTSARRRRMPTTGAQSATRLSDPPRWVPLRLHLFCSTSRRRFRVSPSATYNSV